MIGLMHGPESAYDDSPHPAAMAIYPSHVEVPLQWGEMDALQHVNNAVYFRYFESARIAHLRRLRLGADLAADGVGPVLASINCRFRFPLTYPDSLIVGSRFLSAGGDRAELGNAVYSRRHHRIVAEGQALLVWINVATGRKAPIPDLLLAAIQQEMNAHP